MPVCLCKVVRRNVSNMKRVAVYLSSVDSNPRRMWVIFRDSRQYHTHSLPSCCSGERSKARAVNRTTSLRHATREYHRGFGRCTIIPSYNFCLNMAHNPPYNSSGQPTSYGYSDISTFAGSEYYPVDQYGSSTSVPAPAQGSVSQSGINRANTTIAPSQQDSQVLSHNPNPPSPKAQIEKKRRSDENAAFNFLNAELDAICGRQKRTRIQTLELAARALQAQRVSQQHMHMENEPLSGSLLGNPNPHHANPNVFQPEYAQGENIASWPGPMDG